MDGGQVAKGWDGWRSGGKIKGKSEDTADGSNGTGNIGAIDGAGVPCVSRGLGDTVEEELGGDGAIGSVDGDGFVEYFEEAFDG